MALSKLALSFRHAHPRLALASNTLSQRPPSLKKATQRRFWLAFGATGASKTMEFLSKTINFTFPPFPLSTRPLSPKSFPEMSKKHPQTLPRTPQELPRASLRRPRGTLTRPRSSPKLPCWLQHALPGPTLGFDMLKTCFGMLQTCLNQAKLT